MPRVILAMIVMIVMLLSMPTLAQNDTLDAASTIALAQDAFADARAALEENPAAAQQLFARSALLFERVITSGDIQNADLYFNHANALALSDQTGRAVAAYLRAQRLRPHDDDIAAGLSAARSQSALQITPSPGIRAAQVLTIWRGVIPRNVMLWTAIGSWLALWIAAGLRIAGRWRPSRSVLSTSAVVAVVTMGALLLEQSLLYTEPIAVVVADNTLGYNGPDQIAYEQTFTTPLSQGVECVILEERDGWLRIALRSGHETWVLREQVERV